MESTQYLLKDIPQKELEGAVCWQSPSNIAIIKYWGKRAGQLPYNPSVSFSMEKSYTQTEIEFAFDPKQPRTIDYSFQGEPYPAFAVRIDTYLLQVEAYFPFLRNVHLKINSFNTFPHSSGIASSASFFSSLALCLGSIEESIFEGRIADDTFLRKASYLARIGSGSACRSVYGGVAQWGQTGALKGSSNQFALSLNHVVHPVFKTYCNSILLLGTGVKKLSSSAGHKLMDSHAWAKARYKQAEENFGRLLTVLAEGNQEEFAAIACNEAMSLHALLMTSTPGTILLLPQTLRAIVLLWKTLLSTQWLAMSDPPCA